MAELEALEERRDQAKKNLKTYRSGLARAYDKLAKPRKFQSGDLVLKTVALVMRGTKMPKFVPKWEGPFQIVEANDSEYCKISKLGIS